MSKLLMVLICGFLCPFLLLAQDPEGGGTAAEEEVPALLRGWIYGADEPEVSLVLVDEQGGEESAPLASSSGGAVSAGESYRSFKPGSRAVELRSQGKVLTRAELTLRKEGVYTLLGWKNGAQWQLRLFSDAAPPANAVDRPLRIINFAGKRDTLLSIDAGAEEKVAAASVQELRCPRKPCMVRVRVLALDDGPPAQSSVEIDFRSLPSAYVVVGPDYRGRMRPRVIAGGKAPPMPDDVPQGEEGEQQ